MSDHLNHKRELCEIDAWTCRPKMADQVAYCALGNREVEEHEHRLAAEAQEQALATRIGDLCEDFLADAGAGMIPNVFDRVAIGFAALQDAFVEETKHFAHEAAEAAHLRAQAGLDRARFQNATLRVQLEQNRIAAQQVQEQMKLQLRIAKQRSTRAMGARTP